LEGKGIPAMKSAVENQPVPLSVDEHGVMRVGQTRAPLETIVAAYDAGSGCEEIAQQYPSLQLSDIYLVIGYYLTYREELQSYLDRRAVECAEVRSARPLAPAESNREIRRRLLNRRENGK
jgi:uncharacterized protein (DUF433 family)